jgi:nicotine blue oxidoreductase
VAVVLGAGADAVEAAAELGDALVVRNAAWATGMGSSLRAGLAALAELEPPPAAAVVALVDQPLVGAGAVRRLVAGWQAAPGSVAAVATYAGRPRNPVLLDRSAWAAAAGAAHGDEGARGFLRGGAGYDAPVVEVACDGTGSPDDIDTPEQLAALTVR